MRLISLCAVFLALPVYADVVAAKRAYESGDYATALREFRESAQNGDLEAETYLGQMYWRGLGLRRNPSESVRWFRQAADAGYVKAEVTLAYLYWEGKLGVTRDFCEAFRWATKAVAKGDAKACLLLAGMYSEGQGVPRDYIQSYIWTRLAAQKREDKDIPDSAITEMLDFLSHRITLKEALSAELLIRNRADGPANAQKPRETEIPGLLADDFLWEQGCGSVGTRFSVAIRNSSLNSASDFKVQVVFLGRDQKPIDFQVLTFDGVLPAGLSKRVSGTADRLTRKLACGEMQSLIDLQYERYQRQTARGKQAEEVTKNLDFLYQEYEVIGDADLATRFARVGLKVMASGNNRPIAPRPASAWPNWAGGLSGVQLRPSTRANLEPAAVFKKVAPSVYAVLASASRDRVSGDDVFQGSAIAVTQQELITNCHIVEGMTYIVIRQKERVSEAKLVKSSPESDRCIIRVESAGLNPIQGVRSYSDLSVGERAYSVGTPSGLEQTLGEGLISGLREDKGTKLVQTSAPISPGSSGGGLFDASGNLIGITTFMLRDAQSLNFAISAQEFWH